VVGKKGKAVLEALAVTLITILFLCFFTGKEKQLQFLLHECYFDFLQVKNSVSPNVTDIRKNLQNLEVEGLYASVSSLNNTDSTFVMSFSIQTVEL
jgi:hypothetical protein